METFRIATTKDIEGIYEVMVSTGYISAFYKFHRKEDILPRLTANIFDASKTVVICLWENKVVAYSIFGPYAKFKKKIFPEEPSWFAYSLGTGVLTSIRSGGMGTKIRLFADETARKLGFKGMYTDVATTNSPSQRVQQKAGFELVDIYDDPKRGLGVGSVLYRKEF